MDGRFQSPPRPCGRLVKEPHSPSGVSLWGIAELEQIVFNSNGNAKQWIWPGVTPSQLGEAVQ